MRSTTTRWCAWRACAANAGPSTNGLRVLHRHRRRPRLDGNTRSSGRRPPGMDAVEAISSCRRAQVTARSSRRRSSRSSWTVSVEAAGERLWAARCVRGPPRPGHASPATGQRHAAVEARRRAARRGWRPRARAAQPGWEFARVRGPRAGSCGAPRILDHGDRAMDTARAGDGQDARGRPAHRPRYTRRSRSAFARASATSPTRRSPPGARRRRSAGAPGSAGPATIRSSNR